MTMLETQSRSAPPGCTGVLFDVQRFCLHDGPGIRTTAFFKGCPLGCFWCHNPEGLSPHPQLMFTKSLCGLCGECARVCPNGVHRVDGRHDIDRSRCRACGECVAACPNAALVLRGREWSLDELMEAIAADRPYYDSSGGGVTLSGGEPLAQAGFAAALLRGCTSAGIHTAVDTSLHADWSVIEPLVPVTHLWLVDVKHADSRRHREGAGVGNELALSNLQRLCSGGARVVVRVPIVPGFNDAAADVRAIASRLANLPIECVELLPLHRMGEGKRQSLGLPPAMGPATTPSAAAMAEIARVFSAAGLAVRGVEKGCPTAPAPDRYQRRYDALYATKLRHTSEKRQSGPRDLDDWGQIPLNGEFRFTPQTEHPKGRVLGARDCGRNFRRLLAACPVYIDANSSLLGGYYGTFNEYVTGWDPDCGWDHLTAAHEKYGIVHGIASTQHFLSDAQVGLDLGWGGLLDKIEHYRKVNRGEQQQAFYDGLTEFVRGVQEWIGAHVAAARAQAAAERDPDRRANLREMADLNQRIISAPPATFREACQWLAWYQMAKRVYIGGGSIGRLDCLLWPYYQRESAAGTLTDDDAIFHLACFLLKDSSYVQVGGVDEHGRDVTNAVSLLVLEAAHRMRIPANIAVMVHDKMDPRLMQRATELLLADRMGIPRFAGMNATIDGFVRRGYPLEAARQRVQAGCHWFCVPGREYSFCDVIKINLAKVMLAALDQMLGATSAPSVERLWELFREHLQRAVDTVAAGIDLHIEHQHRFYPELALSLLCHGPIEKGVDASHGSLEFTNIGVDGAGLATVADSFSAMEQRIDVEKALSWSDLRNALQQNWSGSAGQMRQLMRRAAGFGRACASADAWARRISSLFAEIVVAKPTAAGHAMSPGLFSWASTIPMGRQTPATPDGRCDSEPVSFGANPNAGLLHGGSVAPTTASTAIAQVQCGCGNPAPFQFDVDLGGRVDAEAVAKLESLIRTHFAMGGTLINANVLDRETLLDACRDPGRYPDLVVRVTGFSAYFASLSDDFRKLVYERIIGGQ